MTFPELANSYFGLIWNLFQNDVHTYSQWWLYAPLLIPFMGYSVFFVLKWAFLTAPIWIPLNLVFGWIRRAVFKRTIEAATRVGKR